VPLCPAEVFGRSASLQRRQAPSCAACVISVSLWWGQGGKNCPHWTVGRALLHPAHVSYPLLFWKPLAGDFPDLLLGLLAALVLSGLAPPALPRPQPAQVWKVVESFTFSPRASAGDPQVAPMQRLSLSIHLEMRQEIRERKGAGWGEGGGEIPCQCAVGSCLWCGRVHLSPWGCSPSWHSPVQGKELAVTVEGHVPQVEDLQPCEVAHVGDIAHFVALQVEASDLGTETGEGTGGNLQRSDGESGGPDGARGANLCPRTANQPEGLRACPQPVSLVKELF